MSITLLRAASVVGVEEVDAVLVKDGLIAEVGRQGGLGGPAPDRVIDLGSLVLAPGFIDTHVHMTGNGLPDAPLTIQEEPPAILSLRAAENSRQALAEGVTTMRDCGALNEVVFPFREAARRGVVAAPNILATGGALTRTGGHGHWWGLEADTPDEVRKAVRAQSKAGADALKVMVDGGIDLGRHVPGLLYFDESDMELVATEARDWGLPVAAHCLTAPGVRAAVSAGVTSIEHCIFYELDVGDTRYDPEVGQAIVSKGIYVDPGLAFAYDVFTDPEAETSFPANARMFRSRLEDAGAMHAQGVKLVAGTDAGWYATPFGHYARQAELLVHASGLSAAQAFDSCTRIAAESLGLGSVTGSIEPGKEADLVALEGDPTQDISAMSRVRMTMVGGRVLFEAGVVTGGERPPDSAEPLR